ncbi:ABC transporter permease [Streptomyces sp. NPDC021093]|uniref:ABC transporter permease n=1 Tax=Streptomyces sp. NPDC021093 TaxID=3365112 RepID=UPI00379E8F0D
MSAVWRASRAAVKRRRLQTVVIGLVVFCSTVTVMLALGLLLAAEGPFEKSFEEQRGAHAVTTLDRSKVTDAQASASARRSGVAAAAGPFGLAVLDVPTDLAGSPPGPLAVVGRADPAGPVDRVELLGGRWATGPGEIVLGSVHGGYDSGTLGLKVRARGAPPLTVVGFATSMSKSAAAWVTPAQLAALHPKAVQMLYRFDAADTQEDVASSLAGATAELPRGAVASSQSYLTLKRAFSSLADAYLPFMTVFGVLGLLVSVLIVGNVVSGAVVSGYRHIGVLKALGFTPNQVVAVYLVMVSVPAVAGCALGTLAGGLLTEPVLKVAFGGIQTGTAAIGLSPWVVVVCLLGMPALVAVTALVPALRAHRLSAARAITAGSVPRTGRGLRVQRALAGTRLPRAVSMGLGQPFARPGRAGLTMAAIVLGVVTVTVTVGLSSTMIAFGNAGKGDGRARIDVQVGRASQQQTVPKLDDAAIEKLLRTLPGAAEVTARGLLQVRLVGYAQNRFANFYRGDPALPAALLVAGRLPKGPGEVLASPEFLAQHGLVVGDRITLEAEGREVAGVVVGRTMEGNPLALDTTWETLERLSPGTKAIEYGVRLTPGADAQGYVDAVRAADPGLHASVGSSGNSATTTVVGFSSVFTVLLSTVAALGVFNTVLLNVRERRRDLGMLKSIGMTPRQVVVMTVTSVAGLGFVGGLLGIPLGVAGHRWIVERVGIVEFPASMKEVWDAPQLLGLGLAGVAIAALGAAVPARSAGRLRIAKVLHNE